MGLSMNPNMHYELTNLVQRSDSLSHLSEPFTREEIQEAVKRMPTDKAPGQMDTMACSSKNVGTLLSMISMSSAIISLMVQ